MNLVFLKQRALGDQKVLLFFILLMVLQEMCQFQFISEMFKVIIGIKIYIILNLPTGHDSTSVEKVLKSSRW